MSIPLVDLAWQHAQIDQEVRRGWDDVVASGAYVQGPAVAAFEEEFATYVGAASCIGVANGTDALEIALRAMGVGVGDIVALPANTFIATAFAVVRCGAVPRLVDVDSDTLLMDPERLDGAGCKAIVPVHLYGQLAPMAEIVAAADGVPVLEDAAQSQGATQAGTPVGGWGLAAATSFYPGKNLGAYGDAGALVTDDPDLTRRIRLIANHGSAIRYTHEVFGFNSRLDTLQAVVLRAKLRRLDEWNSLRREAAARYDAMLADEDRVRLLQTAPGNNHVWHLYPVRVRDRDAVLARLNAIGVGAAVHYPTPVHLQPAFAGLGQGPGSYPVAEQAAQSLLTLPLYPGITEEQQQQVVDGLLAALR